MKKKSLYNIGYAFIVAVAVPLVVYATASIPSACTTPGDCDAITPRFETLTVKHSMSGEHLYISGSGASPLLVTTGSGSVGIGTSNPTSFFQIQGSVGTLGVDAQGYGVITTRANQYLRFADFNLGWISFQGSADNYATRQEGAAIRALTAGDGTYTWQNVPAAGLAFDTTPNTSGGTLTERMRIAASGNVGIGTTTPSAKLSVAGTMSGRQLYVSGTGSNPILSTNADGKIGLGTAPNTNTLTVSGSTYLFNSSNTLYTSTGSTWLPISNTGAVTMLNITNVSGTSGAAALIVLNAATEGGIWGANSVSYIGAVSSDSAWGASIVFGARTAQNQYTERMRIDETTGNGYVGIGTSAPRSTLEVNSVIQSTPTDSPGTCNSSKKGGMYFDTSMNEPCFCDGSNWKQFDGGGNCT